MSEFRTIQSVLTFQGRAFALRRDKVLMPDGRVSDIDVVDHHGAVTLVPVDNQERIWFVRQYRHPVGGMLLELPAGTLEDQEDVRECAAREIREEIGHSAQELELIGEFYLAPGYSTEYMYVFLAGGLQPDPLEMDDDEFLQVEPISIQQTYQMLADREFCDAKTLLALHLARAHLLSADDETDTSQNPDAVV